MLKQPSPENPQNINEFYFAIFKRLVQQRALDESVISPEKGINLKYLQKVTETVFTTMKEDTIFGEFSLKEFLDSSEQHQKNINSITNSTPIQVMSFPKIILYKTLPCPKGQQCKGKPREIAPYNQYSDEELSCGFYHHHKDRRRITITHRVHDEFLYKANYDRKKEIVNNAVYSRNYFESIYHPIYYKLFKCKRVGCNKSYYCPFNHNNAEKILWDEIFQIYFLKKREMYTGKNFNFPLKELGKIPFETDFYFQSDEKELATKNFNLDDFNFKDNLSWEKLSFDIESENEKDYQEDYDPEFDKNNPISLPKSTSLNYLTSPLFSFVQTTAVSLNYSPTTSLNRYSKTDCLIPTYISKTDKKIYRNVRDDYDDFPLLTPMKISPENCEKRTSNDNFGALGHFFDWEKVKNIMNIHLSKPIA